MACGATLKRSLEFDPLYSPSQSTPKRRRCAPVTLPQTAPPTKRHASGSNFPECTPLTSGQIADALTAELKRIQRRRQLSYPCSMSPPPEDLSPAPSPPLLDSSRLEPASLAPFSSMSPSKRDQPIFTFRQVSLICERMVKEREEKIRVEYDQVLNNKLSEQYEAFLKFNHDQLHRRFGDTPMSYVS